MNENLNLNLSDTLLVTAICLSLQKEFPDSVDQVRILRAVRILLELPIEYPQKS